MNNKKYFKLIPTLTVLFLIGTLALSSCSSIKFSERKGKDLNLTSRNYSQLEGTYIDSIVHKIPTILYKQFENENIVNSENFSIQFNPISKKRIELKLMQGDNVISSTILKGRYRKGYFKLKTKWQANFLLGPLVWILGNDNSYIGLTKENNVVVLNAAGGLMLLVAFPIFGADRPPYDFIYLREK